MRKPRGEGLEVPPVDAASVAQALSTTARVLASPAPSSDDLAAGRSSWNSLASGKWPILHEGLLAIDASAQGIAPLAANWLAVELQAAFRKLGSVRLPSADSTLASLALAVLSAPFVSNPNWSAGFTKTALARRKKARGARGESAGPFQALTASDDGGAWSPSPVQVREWEAVPLWAIVTRASELGLPIADELVARASLLALVAEGPGDLAPSSVRGHPGVLAAGRAFDLRGTCKVKKGHDLSAEGALRLRVAQALAGRMPGLAKVIRPLARLGKVAGRLPDEALPAWRRLVVLGWLGESGDWIAPLPDEEIVALLSVAVSEVQRAAAYDLAAVLAERAPSISAELIAAVQPMVEALPSLRATLAPVLARGDLRALRGASLLAATGATDAASLANPGFRRLLLDSAPRHAVPAAVTAIKRLAQASHQRDLGLLEGAAMSLERHAETLLRSASDFTRAAGWIPRQSMSTLAEVAQALRNRAAQLRTEASARLSPAELDSPEMLPPASPSARDPRELASASADFSIPESERRRYRAVLLAHLRHRGAEGFSELGQWLGAYADQPPELWATLWEVSAHDGVASGLASVEPLLRAVEWAPAVWTAILIHRGAEEAFIAAAPDGLLRASIPLLADRSSIWATRYLGDGPPSAIQARAHLAQQVARLHQVAAADVASFLAILPSVDVAP